jgi:hypothetical protein
VRNQAFSFTWRLPPELPVARTDYSQVNGDPAKNIPENKQEIKKIPFLP